MNQINPVVKLLANKQFSGNIIHDTWHLYLINSKGSTNTKALLILSEIVYWYKPTIKRDENTNQSYIQQKFKSDKLQKSYSQLGDKFGLTKDEVRNAIDFLEEKGIITKEFRTIDVNGQKLSNVMFLEPVYKKLMEMSIVPTKDTYEQMKGEVSAIEPIPYRQSNPYPIGKITDTYTENTTKTTTKNKEREEKRFIKVKENQNQIESDSSLPKNFLPESEIEKFISEQKSKIPNYKPPIGFTEKQSIRYLLNAGYTKETISELLVDLDKIRKDSNKDFDFYRKNSFSLSFLVGKDGSGRMLSQFENIRGTIKSSYGIYDHSKELKEDDFELAKRKQNAMYYEVTLTPENTAILPNGMVIPEKEFWINEEKYMAMCKEKEVA